jgi:hypothetical protein
MVKIFLILNHTNVWFKPSLIAHTCNPSYSGGRDRRILSWRRGKVSKTLSEKQNTNRRAGGVAREVEFEGDETLHHKK